MSNKCGEREEDGMVVDGDGKQKRTRHENEQRSQTVCLPCHDTASVAAAAVPAGVHSFSFWRPLYGCGCLLGDLSISGLFERPAHCDSASSSQQPFDYTIVLSVGSGRKHSVYLTKPNLRSYSVCCWCESTLGVGGDSHKG